METTSSSTQEKRHPRKQARKTQPPLPKTSKHLRDLLEWSSQLSTKNVKHVSTYYSRDAFFKDPITEVYTADEIQKYFQRLLERIGGIHFVFDNVIEENNQAFVTWVMTAKFMGREFTVEGSSHLKFDSSGLCEYHRDYFDLSEEIYEQVPLFGALFKGLKRVLN